MKFTYLRNYLFYIAIIKRICHQLRNLLCYLLTSEKSFNLKFLQQIYNNHYLSNPILSQHNLKCIIDLFRFLRFFKFINIQYIFKTVFDPIFALTTYLSVCFNRF